VARLPGVEPVSASGRHDLAPLANGTCCRGSGQPGNGVTNAGLPVATIVLMILKGSLRPW
jgi:hypothetical protein